MDFLINLFSPKVAYADLDSFIANVNSFIINPIITFLFALAVVMFLYGMVEFMIKQSSEEAKTNGKRHMIWGIIGITIMMSVWFILGLILDTFDIPRRQIDPENGTVNLPPF